MHSIKRSMNPFDPALTPQNDTIEARFPSHTARGAV
ncbi:hypothetical protein EDC35_101620 [Thiobaca trueperi]|uniref:Uncharacterized protein n=1 Tax=Thiobaca trueperi TaxID=127458 RepID=A0A4R3N535_9GAMM|nr:hypothetical protein EDC35_101620 [Thiobaca trueperi]